MAMNNQPNGPGNEWSSDQLTNFMSLVSQLGGTQPADALLTVFENSARAMIEVVQTVRLQSVDPSTFVNLTLKDKQIQKKKARRHKRRRGRKTKVLSPTLGLKLMT
jgi:hypothetical protein